MSELHGMTALITGGSRGIGLAVATGLARAGAAVIIIGRAPDSVAAATSSLRSIGAEVTGVSVDVSQPEAVAAAYLDLGERAEVDILVCAAGVMSERTAKTLRTTPAEWRRVLGTNLDGVFSVVSTFAPGMVQRRRGRIVTLSACLGRFSGPGTAGGLAPYRVAKAGVNALTKNLAAELGSGSRGVLVDAVCPGHCRTDMGGPTAPRSAEEGADTVLWLAQRPASSAITGMLWEDRRIIPW
jgi:3-oxoacyl-[acyl-carrier protein] reductase